MIAEEGKDSSASARPVSEARAFGWNWIGKEGLAGVGKRGSGDLPSAVICAACAGGALLWLQLHPGWLWCFGWHLGTHYVEEHGRIRIAGWQAVPSQLLLPSIQRPLTKGNPVLNFFLLAWPSCLQHLCCPAPPNSR